MGHATGMAIQYQLPHNWIHYAFQSVAQLFTGAKAARLALTQIPYQRSWADRLEYWAMRCAAQRRRTSAPRLVTCWKLRRDQLGHRLLEPLAASFDGAATCGDPRARVRGRRATVSRDEPTLVPSQNISARLVTSRTARRVPRVSVPTNVSALAIALENATVSIFSSSCTLSW
jgi:hypothetical protein